MLGFLARSSSSSVQRSVKIHRPYAEKADEMSNGEAVAWLVVIFSESGGGRLFNRVQETVQDYNGYSGVPAAAANMSPGL